MFYQLMDKMRRLVERCDICLTKERSIKPKMATHVPSTVGNVGEKVFIDLLRNSEKEPLFVDSARWIHKI